MKGKGKDTNPLFGKTEKVINAPDYKSSYHEEQLSELLALPNLLSLERKQGWFKKLSNLFEKKKKFNAGIDELKKNIIDGIQALMLDSRNEGLIVEGIEGKNVVNPFWFEHIGFDLTNSGENASMNWIKHFVLSTLRPCEKLIPKGDSGLTMYFCLGHLAKGSSSAMFINFLKSGIKIEDTSKYSPFISPEALNSLREQLLKNISHIDPITKRWLGKGTNLNHLLNMAFDLGYFEPTCKRVGTVKKKIAKSFFLFDASLRTFENEERGNAFNFIKQIPQIPQ